jgi:hypothetical protein
LATRTRCRRTRFPPPGCDAAAIWDAAIFKIILGGGTNARDLADLSALIGDRDEETIGHSRDGPGQHTTSTSVR